MASRDLATQQQQQQQQQHAPPAIPPHMKLVAGKMVSMCLDVVCTLGVPDLLKDGQARSADELAKQCSAHADRLYRVMRALTNDGVFVEHEGKKFTLGEQGQFFRADHPFSSAAAAKWIGGPLHTQAWMHLLHSVKTGEPAAKVGYGCDTFEYFNRDPARLKIFQDCMTESSKAMVPPIVAAYKGEWSKFKTICDIGGGLGSLLAQILQASESSNGILYEMPELAQRAGPIFEEAGVADRVRCEGGDFFESVPKQVDLFVMKFIIHDHDDERCAKILKNCREGLNPGGRILIFDQVVPTGNEPSISKLMDVEMLAMLTGRERTEAEFSGLLKSAGLRLNRIVPVQGPLQIIEAEPAEAQQTHVPNRG